MTQSNGIPSTLFYFAAGILASVLVVIAIRKKMREKNPPSPSVEDPPSIPFDEIQWKDRLTAILRAQKLPDSLPDDFAGALKTAGELFSNQGKSFVRKSVSAILQQIESLEKAEGLEDRFQSRVLHLREKLIEERKEWCTRLSEIRSSMEHHGEACPHTTIILLNLNKNLASAGLEALPSVPEGSDADDPGSPPSVLAISALLSGFAEIRTALGAVSFCDETVSRLASSWEDAKQVIG